MLYLHVSNKYLGYQVQPHGEHACGRNYLKKPTIIVLVLGEGSQVLLMQKGIEFGAWITL